MKRRELYDVNDVSRWAMGKKITHTEYSPNGNGQVFRFSDGTALEVLIVEGWSNPDYDYPSEITWYAWELE